MRGLFGTIAHELKANASLTTGQIDKIWGDLFGHISAKAGPAVNVGSALRVTTFLACVRKIAEANSTVPIRLFQRPPNTSRRQAATDHPLYDLLEHGPNEWQDSLQFRETMAIHAAVCGNAFAFVNRVRGRIVELIPIVPTHVAVKRTTDQSTTYSVTAPDGTREDFSSKEILHIRNLSWDGVLGLDMVNLLREPLGLALATEQTHAMLHANGTRPSGVVSVEKTLDEKNLIRLAAWVRKHYGGLDNVSRIMVLDNDAKFTPFEMKGVDAQHLETRRHEIEAICHGMGVLPLVIGYPADIAARAAADTLLSMHLAHTIRPWHRRFEKAFDRQLLTKQERGEGYYTKFIDGEFLRATAKDRAEYNKIALGGGGNPGWATPNDVRGWDEMEEIEGGDHLYVPTNIGPADEDGIPMIAVRSTSSNSGQ